MVCYTGWRATADVGTTSVVLNAVGNKVSEARHYPYGEERWHTRTLQTDYRFTGQRLDSYIKLYFMGARQMDPELGRWISPDSIIPEPANPQSFNRYSYTGGNPLRYTDPTGRAEAGECDQDDQGCAGENPPVDLEQLLASMAELIYDPSRTVPIVIPFGAGYVVIMPPGANPQQERPEGFQGAADVFTGIGVALDYIEMMTLIAGGTGEVVAWADFGAAIAGNSLSGDMWLFGKPDPNLPPMFLAGQDVLWTGGVDLASPYAAFALGTAISGDPIPGAAAKTVVDFFTTGASFIYDWSRLDGMPVLLNAGVSITLQPFLLLYP